MNIQLHGGIAFTWEHDAHLDLRRATAPAALAGSPERAADDVFELSAQGVRRRYGVALPPEAEQYRAAARQFAERYLAVPHWSKPFGRETGPAGQLVIEEELGGRHAAGDAALSRAVGEVIAEELAMEPGNLTKILFAEHAQRVSERACPARSFRAEKYPDWRCTPAPVRGRTEGGD